MIDQEVEVEVRISSSANSVDVLRRGLHLIRAALDQCVADVGIDVGEFLVDLEGQEYFGVYVTKGEVLDLRIAPRTEADAVFNPQGLTSVPGE